MIQFDQTHIGYGTSLVRTDGLRLEGGKLYVLIGRNGAGKSTVLKSIIGEIPVLEGTIRIKSKPVVAIDSKEIAKTVAFVRTVFPATNFLSVYDYIALGRSPYTNAIGRLTDEDKRIIEGAIDVLGIHHLREKFTSDISDGEKQLVNIAKALAQKTAVILLDEPTAFLDYTNKQKVIQVLKEIAGSLNKCIIISSHDIDISLNNQCEFIAINHNELILLPSSTTKEEIVITIFNS